MRRLQVMHDALGGGRGRAVRLWLCGLAGAIAMLACTNIYTGYVQFEKPLDGQVPVEAPVQVLERALDGMGFSCFPNQYSPGDVSCDRDRSDGRLSEEFAAVRGSKRRISVYYYSEGHRIVVRDFSGIAETDFVVAVCRRAREEFAASGYLVVTDRGDGRCR